LNWRRMNVNFWLKSCHGGHRRMRLKYRRPGFTSRQRLRFVGKYSNAVVYNFLQMRCLCFWKREVKVLAQ
jgi:hypothetical protein